MLVLVVGPSGAGKDTLLNAAKRSLEGDVRFRFVRREITRPESAGGEAHLGIDADSFASRRSEGAYTLHWQAHGLEYGIPADIENDLAAGRVVVANVSRVVIAEAARRFRLRVLEITAPPVLLARRLGARGREAADDIAARLARSVMLPEGVDIVTVINDSTPEEGVASVLEVLSRAAADALPG